MDRMMYKDLFEMLPEIRPAQVKRYDLIRLDEMDDQIAEYDRAIKMVQLARELYLPMTIDFTPMFFKKKGNDVYLVVPDWLTYGHKELSFILALLADYKIKLMDRKGLMEKIVPSDILEKFKDLMR